MLLSVVSTLVLLFVAGGNGKSTNCPDFVPTSKDTALIAGQVYASYYATYGHPTYGLKMLRCLTKFNEVNSYGTITSLLTYREDTSNDLKNFTAVATPVDHNRARLSYVSSSNPDNADIRTLLDVDPANYVIWAFCQTVDGLKGYALLVNARDKQLSQQSLDKVKTFLRNSKLTDDLQPYDQENC